MPPFDHHTGDDSQALSLAALSLAGLAPLCAAGTLGDVAYVIAAAGKCRDAELGSMDSFSKALAVRLTKAEQDGVTWSRAHDAAASAPNWVWGKSSALLWRCVQASEHWARMTPAEKVVEEVLAFDNPMLRRQVVWAVGPLTERATQKILADAPELLTVLARHPRLTTDAARCVTAHAERLGSLSTSEL
jgi:hypothetical protein